MVDKTKKYISDAICVMSFNQDKEIRLKQASAEKTFEAFLSTQSIQTNVPDDFDPTAPRLIFQAKNKQLVISQVATQLSLSFEPKTKSLIEQLDIIAKNAERFYSGVVEFKGEGELKESGIIVSLNYPSDESQQIMNEYIYNHFFKIRSLGEVASANFKVGFKDSELFYINFEAMVYELHKKEFKPTVSRQVIKIADIPIVERGYMVKIDLNNRPMLTGSQIAANRKLDGIMKKVSAIVLNEIDKFMGFLN